MELTSDIIQSAVNGMDTFGGISYRSYSGRGMYGKECAAVEIEDLGHLVKLGIALAYEVLTRIDSDDDALEALEEAISDTTDPKIDSLGMGYVAYWPGVEA